MLSPVDFISGPRTVSDSGNFKNGNTDSFTATWSILISLVKSKSFNLAPFIIHVATFARGTPIALLTNGTVLLARGFASMI